MFFLIVLFYSFSGFESLLIPFSFFFVFFVFLLDVLASVFEALSMICVNPP